MKNTKNSKSISCAHFLENGTEITSQNIREIKPGDHIMRYIPWAKEPFQIAKVAKVANVRSAKLDANFGISEPTFEYMITGMNYINNDLDRLSTNPNLFRVPENKKIKLVKIEL